jgi:hypothetical protein
MGGSPPRKAQRWQIWLSKIPHNLRGGLAPSQARRFLAPRVGLTAKKECVEAQEVAAAEAQLAFFD